MAVEQEQNEGGCEAEGDVGAVEDQVVEGQALDHDFEGTMEVEE